MARMKELMKRFTVLEDLELVKILRSEIDFELSSNKQQSVQNGSLGEFVLESDSPRSKDVVLRSKSDSGEEVAVSAVIRPPYYDENDNFVFGKDALMKVCLKKPTLSSILQFDCNVYEDTEEVSRFDVDSVYYLKSDTCFGSSTYKGPLFSELDLKLQSAFKDYLVSKGIGVRLTSFLLNYLHKREQGQYVNWLEKVADFVTKSELQSQGESSETHSA